MWVEINSDWCSVARAGISEINRKNIIHTNKKKASTAILISEKKIDENNLIK